MSRNLKLGLLSVFALAAMGGVEIAYRKFARASEARVYRIGYNQNPPFQMRNPDGTPTGFAVDVVNAAARRTGAKLSWVFDPTLSAKALQDKSVDLWPLLTDLPERRGFAHISDPWMLSDSYLISLDGAKPLPPRDYAGTIHYSGPDIYVTMMRRRWSKAHLQRFPEPMGMTAPFCAGEFRFLFVSEHQANTILRQAADACPDRSFQMYQLPEMSVLLGVGSTFDHAATADRLRAEILKMAEDGELGGILGKYSYVGLGEVRMLFQLVAAERQSHQLRLAMGGLWVALGLFVLLIWHNVRMRRAAEQASLTKSRFLANMSHEIRTPLGGVIGMVDLALESNSSAERRDYLETAHSSAQALLSILNDILDLSRIEARRLDVTPHDFDMRELVSDVERLMAPVAHGKGLRYDSAVGESVAHFIHADPVRIKQVLLNLVGNAIKFSEQGRVAVAVNRSEANDHTIQIVVEDTGIGIPADKCLQIFEPFRQADGSVVRKYGGSGLGLAITKQLVELMGGKITLHTTPGAGSSFTVTIPYQDAHRAVAALAMDQDLTAQSPIPPLRILVAEDNAVNQKLIRALLEKDGHEVTLVASGGAAVAAVRDAGGFDVILMDIQMPEMDGFQASAAIRKLDGREHIPIVALTAHAQNGFQEICLASGMDAYLSKPIDREQLRGVLRTAPGKKIVPSW